MSGCNFDIVQKLLMGWEIATETPDQILQMFSGTVRGGQTRLGYHVRLMHDGEVCGAV